MDMREVAEILERHGIDGSQGWQDYEYAKKVVIGHKPLDMDEYTKTILLIVECLGL